MDQEVIVKDNFLPSIYFERVRDLVMSHTFEWGYLDDLTFYNPDQATRTFGYYHWFVNNGALRPDATLLADFYERNLELRSDISEVVKSRGAMITTVGDQKLHVPHVDSDRKHVVSILYINQTDGDTVLYNEKVRGNEFIPDNLTVMTRVSPRPNRLLMFTGSHVHTGYSPSTTNRRVWVNSNFE